MVCTALNHSLYEAEVGERVELECPISPGDCVNKGDRPLYQWEKLSGNGESSEVLCVNRTLSFELEGAKDGGWYRCYSWCRGEDPSAWIHLNGRTKAIFTLVTLH